MWIRCISLLCAVFWLAHSFSAEARDSSVEVVGLEQLPPDMTLVVGQTTTVLQGEAPDEALPAFFTEEALSGLTMYGTLDYPGFAVASAGLLEYALVETEPATMRADFTLMLMDGMGRRGAVGVVVKYGISPSGLLIETAKAAPVYPASPEAELHFVPAGRVPDDLLERFPDHGALLEWARGNAVTPGEVGDYYVFACLTEEVEADAALSLLFSSNREGLQGRYMPAETLYDGGWLISIGRLELSEEASEAQYLKLVFGGGEHKPEALRGARLIGVFPVRP